MGFNDSIWARYKLGEYSGLKDAAGKAYTRNVFHRPTKDDVHLLTQAIQTPAIPAFAEAMPGLGIESLQKLGTKFLLCANALGGGVSNSKPGKGEGGRNEKDLRANLSPT